MPMPSKGHRIALTIRLPVDDYRAAAVRARARGWSMSQFVAYAVGLELGKDRRKAIRDAPGLKDRTNNVGTRLRQDSAYG